MLLGLGTCVTTIAQESDSFNVDLAACIDLDTEEARFACYEERVNAARSNEAAPGGAASQSSATAAESPQPIASDAQTAGNAVARPQSGRDAGPFERQEIFGTITELREITPNTWVITLDNGQIWQMNQPRRYPLRVGLEVMLYDTRWGSSYRLTAPEHGSFVQVELVN